MKKLNDPRHLFRRGIVQALYSKTYAQTEAPKLSKKQREAVEKVLHHSEEINEVIDTYATTFNHSKMAKIDYALLQLGLYELLFASRKEPYKVIIDESIELAKEYGSEGSPKLINGILAKAVSLHITNVN